MSPDPYFEAFETEAQCEHIYCYIHLTSRKRVSGNGNLTCPECKCIASNIIHHQPIRLDDGFAYLRNTPQTLLGRCEGHQCGICFDDFNLCDADLATMDTDVNCRHIFCFPCLSRHKVTKLGRNEEHKDDMSADNANEDTGRADDNSGHVDAELRDAKIECTNDIFGRVLNSLDEE